jgi:hypothetical protein
LCTKLYWGLVIDRVKGEGTNVGKFAVVELDKNICGLSVEVRAEGRVEVNEIDLREIFTRDIGDKHKR